MSTDSERKVLRDPLRRSIARVCAEEARGSYAIATELGLPPKKIASQLKTMEKAGCLEVEGSDGRASRLYRLRDGLQGILEEAAAEAREPGLLRDAQTFLLVEADDPNAVPRALSPADVSGALAWSARLGGEGPSYLLAFEPQAGALAVDSAIDLLHSAGAEVRHLTVNEIVAVDEFRQRGKLMRQRSRSRRKAGSPRT